MDPTPCLTTSDLRTRLSQAWGTHAKELAATKWAPGVSSESFGTLALRTSYRRETFSPWAWGLSGVETGACMARSYVGMSGWERCWAPEWKWQGPMLGAKGAKASPAPGCLECWSLPHETP